MNQTASGLPWKNCDVRRKNRFWYVLYTWQNGRIERLFGTLKQVLDQWVVSGIEQLNRDLDTFRYWYNHIRQHQNLDGRTPAEAWSGIDPYAKPPKQDRWFEAWDGLLSGYH